MLEYRTSAHAVFDIKYHVVWITKYRYKILRGRVAERARDLLRQICHSPSQYLGPIFRDPHDVILDIEDRVRARPVFEHPSILSQQEAGS